MKKAKFFIIAFIALFAVAYGMDAPSRSIDKVQIFFTNHKGLKNELFSILDNATKQVLVAMYWITDESIIDKLIELKQKGIDVQVIFDKSSGIRISINHSISLMKKFLRNDIIPLILPSKPVIKGGIMHNKFLIVDTKIVWTGSANFTKTVFDPKSRYRNDENVIILHSSADAQKFSKEFFDIEKGIIELYIRLISDANKILPRWITKLSSILYKKNPRFKEILNQLLPKLTVQKNREQFFSRIQIIEEEEEPTSLPEEPATYKQIKYIKQEGGIDLKNMSKEGASNIISGLLEQIEQEKRPREYHQSYPIPFRRAEPATQDQRRFLEYRGRFTEGMSQRRASALICIIKQQEQEQPYKRPRYN